MKKIFIAGTMMLALTSCNLMGTPSTSADYTSLYNANIKAELQNSSDFFKAMLGKTQEIAGSFSTKIEGDVQGAKASVQVATDLTGIAEPLGNSETSFVNPNFSLKIEGSKTNSSIPFNKMAVSGKADSISMANTLKGIFFKYDNPQVSVEEFSAAGAPDTQMQEANVLLKQKVSEVLSKLQQFSGKWMKTPMDEYQAKQSETLIKILSLTVADFEKYLTKYQLYTPTSEKGVEKNSKVTFDVTLNHQNIVNLLAEVTKDLTDYQMSESEKKALLESLEEVVLSGTITYDRNDALYSEFTGVIGEKDAYVAKYEGQTSGMASELKMRTLRSGEKMEISGTFVTVDWKLENETVVKQPEEEMGKFTFTSETKSQNTKFALEVFTPDMSASDTSKLTKIAQLSGEMESGIPKMLDGNLSLGLINGTLSYKYGEYLTIDSSVLGSKAFELKHKVDNHKHSGFVSFQNQKAAEWSAEVKNDALESLSITLENFAKYFSYDTASSSSSKPLFSLNLAKKNNESFARGKMELAVFPPEVFSADVGLQVEPKEGKFGFTLGNISLPQSMNMSNEFRPTYFEIFVTSKSKDTEKTVAIPTETADIREFLQMLETLD